MKVSGIILLVFAVLNLLVAIMAASSGAPADAVSSKFSGFFMLSVIGGLLYFFGSKKHKRNQGEQQATKGRESFVKRIWAVY